MYALLIDESRLTRTRERERYPSMKSEIMCALGGGEGGSKQRRLLQSTKDSRLFAEKKIDTAFSGLSFGQQWVMGLKSLNQLGRFAGGGII